MTSESTLPQQLDGRSVRGVVECNQELVSEPWCRRIIRQLLQSLELQYAMHMPHRPITPDTLQVLDSGDPLLLPAQETGPAGTEAGDMHDLAAVIHYAITREYPPQAPLRGRVREDYSAGFVDAIDRCLARDSSQRPQSIDAMRTLLGIVPLGPAIPAPAPAAPPRAALADPAPTDPAPVPEPGGLKRQLMLGAAAAVLLAAAGGLFALLHQADSRDALTLSLPPAEPAAPAPPEAVPPVAMAASATPALAEEPAPAPSEAPAAVPAVATATQPAPAPPVAAAAGASYKLLIKPWAMVVVDGVDHGASPPLKRLTLAPGPHTIRILNPNFPEHTITLTSVKGDVSVIELDLTEEAAE